jgi:adenylate kinase family enzyme
MDNECIIELKKLLNKKECWIIEGIYDWGKIATNQSDLLIFLNYNTNIAIFRVIKRWLIDNKRKKETIKELFSLIKYI